MIWPIVLLIATPFLIGVCGLVVRNRQTFDVLHCVQAGIMVISSILLVEEVSGGGPVSFLVFLRVDAVSAWFDLVIGIVAGTGTLYAVGYVGEQYDRGDLSLKRFRYFFILFDLYLGVMLLAVNVENLGIMWIAIEGATLSAALLIGFERSKGALEAGWKFVILSSVGIALALFGTILVYYSSEQLLGITAEALHWAKLYEVGDKLDSSVMKIAFIFILVGYGTKAVVGAGPGGTVGRGLTGSSGSSPLSSASSSVDSSAPDASSSVASASASASSAASSAPAGAG
jgi:hydrogenase-4 component F